MNYVELFRLALEHGYYTDRRCPDFQIEATPETQKLLRNHRAKLQHFPSEVRILIPTTNGEKTFIPLPDSPVFTFHLRLENPDFPLFTNLTEFNRLAAPQYTNDNIISSELGLRSRTATTTENFIVQNPSEKEQFFLNGHPLSDLKPTDFIVTGLGSNPSLEFDAQNTRTITLKTTDFQIGAPFMITYPAMPYLQQGVFADIEIKLDNQSATLPGSTIEFHVVFKPQEARWKYYVITDKTDNKTAVPTIKDKDQEITFSDEERTDLTQTPDFADEIASGLANQYPDRQIFRFVSSTLVSCQKAARKNIQFYLDGNKVMNVLPNPALQNYTIDVRNGEKGFALYHIVKYFTH